MYRIALILAALILSACAALEQDAALQRACLQTTTYGEAYGTPDNPGPCWGPVIVRSKGFGSDYIHMHSRKGGQVILIYDGDRLVSYTRG